MSADAPGPEPRPVPVPPTPGRDPRRAGESDVHWKQVLAGFGITLLASQVAGVAASIPLYVMVLVDAAGGAVPVAAPLAVLGFVVGPATAVFAIWWFARHGRKGWAVGGAIYAALCVLLVAACFGVVFLVGL